MEIKLVYFSVDRCGYHHHGNSAATFGSLREALSEIQLWITGKTLRETKAFDPAEGENIFPVYIHDLAIDSQTSDAVVVTWNETPHVEGQVAAAAGDDPVGGVGVSLVDVPVGSIPGFACYFYFIPSKSAVISIRVDGQVHSGQPGMARFMGEFLARYSSHVVMFENDEGVSIPGYVASPAETPGGALPYYRTRQMRIPGKVEWLQERVTAIRKLVRKDLLTTGVPTDRTLMNTVWGWLGVANPVAPTRGSVKFDFEIDCSLTEEDFSSLVQFESLEHDHRKDIGFRLKGDNEVHWLSRALVKREMDINVTRSRAGIVLAQELLGVLSTRRQEIIAEIPE